MTSCRNTRPQYRHDDDDGSREERLEQGKRVIDLLQVLCRISPNSTRNTEVLVPGLFCKTQHLVADRGTFAIH